MPRVHHDGGAGCWRAGLAPITEAQWPRRSCTYTSHGTLARRGDREYLVNTMVGVTARLVSVAVKDHDLDDHVTEGE